nr:hypothetical protein GTC16762_10020 [Pigmentibacter ruber]
MKLFPLNNIFSVSFLSIIFFNVGCHKNKQILEENVSDKNSILSKNLISFNEDIFSESEEENLINQDQSELEQQKIIDFHIKYDEYNIELKKDQQNNFWDLYATIYVDQKIHYINLSKKSLEELESRLNEEIITKKSDDIVQLENDFDIKIDYRSSNRILVTDNATGKFDIYKNIDDIKTVFNGNSFIMKKAKTVKFLLRKIRGKDSHNNVLSLKTDIKSRALVIDGADDLAFALENSGLPKYIELTLKSNIYMLFGGAVFIGYEGANQEFHDVRQEYIDSLDDIKKIRKEIIKNISLELNMKSNLNDSIKDDISNNSSIENLTKLSSENTNFKLKFLNKINEFFKTNRILKASDVNNLIKELALMIEKQNATISSANDNKNLSLTKFKKTFEKLNTIDSLSKLPNTERELIVTNINELHKLQNSLNDSLSKYFETFTILPNIKSGLAYMYYGMLALEGKTLTELVALKAKNYSSDIFKLDSFKDLAGTIGTFGNVLLASGQAQMVIAGLSQFKENIREVKTLNAWLEEFKNSKYWNEVENSKLDTTSKQKILATKKIIETFYKSNRNWILTRSAGDTLITAGQAMMFISSPLIGNEPNTAILGAGATILGVTTSQVADHYIENHFTFDEPSKKSLEAKISDGEFDDSEASYTEKLIDRYEKLVDLSRKKTHIRVWQKIYDYILQYPNMDSNTIINNLKNNWKNKNSSINKSKEIYYKEIYLPSLEEIFPRNNSEIFTRNLEFINKSKQLLINNKDSLSFISFVSTHFKEIDSQIQKNKYTPSSLKSEAILLDVNSNTNDIVKLRNIFNFFDQFEITPEFDRRIVKKIILRNGYFWSRENEIDFKKKISERYLKEISVKTNKQPWNIPNPLPGFISYYFPKKLIKSDMLKKPLFFSQKTKKIFIFDREKFINDLNSYNELDTTNKKIVDEFSRLIFDFNSSNYINNQFLNKIVKFKHAFGKETRDVFHLAYNGIAKNIFKTESFRPLMVGAKEQVDQFNALNNLNLNPKKSNLSKFSNYTYSGIKKFSSFANKYNVFMNFVLMPNSLNQIKDSIESGNVKNAVLDSSNFIFNQTDLALDLLRNIGMKSYWSKHPKTFHNLGSLQAVLNFASAAIDIYKGDELIKNSKLVDDVKIKQDLYINGSLSVATGATSLATGIFLPISTKAGPIGSSIAFSIMFAQGTYNAVRTSQRLRELGYTEAEVVMNSISDFFGTYKKDIDPKYNVREMEYAFYNKIIPSILEENNNKYLKNINSSELYFFNKIVYPEIRVFLPFTDYEISSNFSYFDDDYDYPTITPGEKLESQMHLCLTNNIYSSIEASENEKMNLNRIHNENINRYHSKLALKNTIIKSKESEIFTKYGNDTIPCPSTDTFFPMKEVFTKINSSNVPEKRKANLYFVGFGDQGKHGNMISSIIGDKSSINLYNIHPSSYLLQIYGGEKEDIFEFFDIVKGKSFNSTTNGFIDGKDGIDTITFTNFKNDLNHELTISLNEENTSKDFPNFINIENVIGSPLNDIIHGNENENILYGISGNDKIYGHQENDIIYPGKGLDYLNGGSGKDIYVILKNDIENGNIKTIDNFDSKFSLTDNESFDAIMTDIENIKSKKDGSNLILGYIENKTFIEAIIIKNYFNGENYQHIYISDLKGNIFSSNQNSLYSDDVNLNSLVPIDTLKTNKEYINMNELALINYKFNNIIGSNISEKIIGNHEDNSISGNGGNDILYGNSGKDLLSVYLNTKIETLTSLKYPILNGGTDSDVYVINMDKDAEQNKYFLKIENEDINEDNDFIIINDHNKKITSVKFSKQSDQRKIENHLKISIIDDKNNEFIVLIHKWFDSSKYRHLEVQVGDYLTIDSTLLDLIRTNIEDNENKLSDSFVFNIYNNEFKSIKILNHSFNVFDSNRMDIEQKEIDFSDLSNSKFEKIKMNNDLFLNIENNNSFVLIKDFYLNKKNINLKLNHNSIKKLDFISN